VRDRFFEVAVKAPTRRPGKVAVPILGQLEKFLQGDDARLSAGLGLDVFGDEGGKDLATLARAGDQDVQATFAPFASDRTEVLGELAVGVAAIADRNEDHIALVALDIFQVLYEQGLAALVGAQ